MAGGSTQQTSQTSTTTPWDYASGGIKGAADAATNIWQSGLGSRPNTMNLVTPYSGQTMEGLQGLQALSGLNSRGQGASAGYNSVINNGGFTNPQMGAVANFQSFGQGSGNISSGRFDELGSMASGPSYSERNLAGVAGGDFLNRQDPNFERALKAASDEASNQINLGAAASGRYGGAVHQGNIAREVGNLNATARVNQYNTERANQMSANSLIDSQRMAGLGTALGAAGQSAGVQANNMDRMMGANQNVFSAGQQALGNLGTAYQGQQAPFLDMMKVGGYGEDLYTRQLNDQSRIWSETQNAPWEGLSRYLAPITGMGSTYGTTNATAQQPGQSPLASGLGMASTGVGLLGGLKSLGMF